ncbi:hypothetical protein BDC45DRAFT_567498 [Circinella umbellata]|nr:hypothetical protein BDC45DRAFT_567498 [Circinella umbellata]
MYQNDCTSTTSFKSHTNSDNYEYYVYDESAGNENKDDDDEDDIDEEQSFNADKEQNCEDIDEEQEFKDFSKEKSIVSRSIRGWVLELRRQNIDFERCICIVKSEFNSHSERSFGQSKRGTHAKMVVLNNRVVNISILGAVAAEDVVKLPSWKPQAVTGTPKKKKWKTEDSAVAKGDFQVLYIPPYCSPFLNTIEEFWSGLKAADVKHEILTKADPLTPHIIASALSSSYSNSAENERALRPKRNVNLIA